MNYLNPFQNSSELFRTIFQLAPDGMSISRFQDGLFIDVNKGFSAMFGYAREEVVGQTSYDLHFWRDFLDRKNILKRLEKYGQIDNFETTIVNRSGRDVEVLLSARSIDIGSEKCLLLSYKDVTEISKIQDALSESERQFKDIFETSPDGIVITDFDGIVLDMNSVVEATFGYSREEVIGQTAVSVGFWSSPSQRNIFRAELEEYGKVQNMEIIGQAKKGEQRTYLLSSTFVNIKGEKRILSILRDVTKIKDAEKALQLSEQKHRKLSQQLNTILDGIPDSLILWSYDCKIIWANRGSDQLLKQDHELVIGKSFQDVITLGWGYSQCLLERCVESGEKQEFREKDHDGRIWVMKAFPIFSETGKVENVLTLSTDITEPLRLREEASRSARLAAVGELAAGVAHEINNPNGLILINMSLIHDVFRDLDPLLQQASKSNKEFKLGGLAFDRALAAMPEAIEEVIDSGHRIRQIVQELKEFSSPHSQKEFEPVDMNEVVRKSLKLLRMTIENVTDHFAVNYEDSLPAVSGNRRQLEQVAVNLILNACQALRERSECLVVGVFYDAKHDDVCLRIWDEGGGIEESVLTQITDPFFTTKREVGGTGLGLSISTRIIEEHDGKMEFASTVGHGTTVTVRFPVLKSDEPYA